MADEEDAEAKTEAPSARRLQHAWDEGQVPVGRDVVAVAGLLTGALVLMKLGPLLRDALGALVRETLLTLPQAGFAGLWRSLVRPAALALAVAGSATLGVAVATGAQTRGGFWPQLALPDPSRLAHGFSRLFSREAWVDLLLATLKVGVVAAVAWPELRDGFLTLERFAQAPAAEALSLAGRWIADAGVNVLAAVALVAGVDLAVTRMRFTKKHRMTKDEARREYKEDEGDPLMRSRRKRAHRDLSRGRAAVEVPRADVVVVNPTHIAVALRYRRGEDPAPRVLAKGKDALAEYVRELAREHGIPIVQDVPLARLLYKRVKVGGTVPAETYKAVAAVLAFVYRLSRGQGASR